MEEETYITNPDDCIRTPEDEERDRMQDTYYAAYQRGIAETNYRSWLLRTKEIERV